MSMVSFKGALVVFDFRKGRHHLAASFCFIFAARPPAFLDDHCCSVQSSQPRTNSGTLAGKRALYTSQRGGVSASESARFTHHNAGACPRVRGAGRRRSRPRERPPERHSAGPGGQGIPPSGCDRRVVPESASRASLRSLAVARAGPGVRPRASQVYRNHTELSELGAWFSRKPAGRPFGCGCCGNPGDSLLACGRAKRKQNQRRKASKRINALLLLFCKHHTKFFSVKSAPGQYRYKAPYKADPLPENPDAASSSGAPTQNP